jgi:hypothetical protein
MPSEDNVERVGFAYGPWKVTPSATKRRLSYLSDCAVVQFDIIALTPRSHVPSVGGPLTRRPYRKSV